MSTLAGKTLAITRVQKDAAEFVSLVEAKGGTAIALPTTEIVPRKDAPRKFFVKLRSKKYDYCAFMSARTVEILGKASSELIGALGQTRVIAVGPKTRDALERLGAKVEMVPENFSSKGVVSMLAASETRGKRIIIPRSAAAKRDAAHELAKLGMEVDEVMLYDVRPAQPSGEWELFAKKLVNRQVDAIIFTSGSNVSSFFEILGKLLPPGPDLGRLTLAISLGPLTSQKLAARNADYSEAPEHTVQNAVELAAHMLK